MKSALVLICVVGAVLAASETPRSPVYGYHLNQGLKVARAIRAAEARIAQDGDRIAGGVVTNIRDVPYQVSLTMLVLWVLETACGGVIIGNQRILTAAHCRYDGMLSAQSFSVRAGSNQLYFGGDHIQNIPPANVVMHPQWNPNSAENDIAVMRLPRPLVYSDVIQPIALPSGADVNNRFVGENALASGFGVNFDGVGVGRDQVLHSVRLPVIEDSVCKNLYDIPQQVFFHDSNVCVSGEGGRSICSGDSGGPLAVDRPDGRILIGLTSYGHIEGCQLDYPVAFARVTSYLSWIDSI